MPFQIQNAGGDKISTLDNWLKLAPPKKGKAHWKDFRSAKELARAWLRVNSNEIPVELRKLLGSRQETRPFDVQTAVPELKVKLDSFPGPRHSDLVAEGHHVTKKIVISVEAKADEYFGNRRTILKEQANANSNGKLKRINHLSLAVFGVPVNDQIAGLPYQLLHGLAAAVIEAGNRQADYAVFVVHEFISLTLDFEKVAANACDLEAFIHSVPGWEGQKIRIGKLLPPIHLCGDKKVHEGKCAPGLPRVLFGKIRTLIPLNAASRVGPPPGLQPNGQYLLGYR